jgi:hypothetical protein
LGSLLSSRHPNAATCVALFLGAGLLMVALAAGGWARYGPPTRWPEWVRAGLALVTAACCVGWWWVNAAVEGPVVVPVSFKHGLTVADLFALPALAWAAYLLLAPRH